MLLGVRPGAGLGDLMVGKLIELAIMFMISFTVGMALGHPEKPDSHPLADPEADAAR